MIYDHSLIITCIGKLLKVRRSDSIENHASIYEEFKPNKDFKIIKLKKRNFFSKLKESVNIFFSDPMEYIAGVRFHFHQAALALQIAKKPCGVLIYAVNSGRLFWDSIDAKTAVERHLSQSLKKKIAEFLDSDGRKFFLFDAVFSLKKPHYADASNEIILSPLSIFLVLFLRPVGMAMVPIYFFQFSRQFAKLKVPMGQIIRISLALSFFIIGLHYILGVNKKNIHMLSLTANSILLESLRVFVLEQKASMVVEVQHGVSSKYFDKYYLGFNRLLNAGDHGSLHIYPMLTGDFSLSPVTTPKFCISEEMSNTGINKALLECRSRHVDKCEYPIEFSNCDKISSYVSSECSSFLRSGVPLFAIFGGTGTEKNYYESDSFEFENTCASIIISELEKRGPVDIVYLPHPQNLAISEVKLSSGRIVPTFSKSQLVYFCADYAFGMYSTCLFEAASLGAHVLTSLVPGTGIMHGSLVEKLYAPSNPSFQELRETARNMLEVAPCEFLNHNDKIRRRLEIFLN